MDVREALRQRVNQRMMRMRAALERFDDESAERERVGPRWNVRDLVGHFVFWVTEGAEQIPRLSAGAKPPAYDLERLNEATHRRFRRMSFVMLCPQLRNAEDRFLLALEGVAPAALIGDAPLRTWVDLVGLEHYDHHWPGLEAAARRAE